MSTAPLEGACPCGLARFRVSRQPTRRFLCHCTICQSVYQRPWADALPMAASRITVTTPDEIEYAKYKPAPALDRGVCRSCRRPVVGFMQAAWMRIGFVPTANLVDPPLLPRPSMHLFYHERVEDVADDLTKIAGDRASMWAALRPILAGYLGVPMRPGPAS